jgi:hypothetical protein
VNNPIARAFRQLFSINPGPEFTESSPFGSKRVSTPSGEEQRQSKLLNGLDLDNEKSPNVKDHTGKGAVFLASLREGVDKARAGGAKRRDVSFSNELLKRLPSNASHSDITYVSDRMVEHGGWRMSPIDRHLMVRAEQTANFWETLRREPSRQPELQTHIDEFTRQQAQAKRPARDPKRVWDRPANSALACLIPMMGLEKLQALADQTADKVQDIAKNAQRSLMPTDAFRHSVIGYVAEVEGMPLDTPEAILKTHYKASALLAAVNLRMATINSLADEYHDQLHDIASELDELTTKIEENVADMSAPFPLEDQMEVTRAIDDVVGPRAREQHRIAESIEEYRQEAQKNRPTGGRFEVFS